MANAQIKITADTSQAERAIKDLDRALNGIKDAGKTAAVALAVVTGAAAAVTAAILTTINAAGDIVDAADALGISASKLYELQQAGQLAGVSAEALNATIQRLSVNIGEGLANGTGASVDAMKRLGLNIREVAGLKPDEQFKRVAQSLLEIENPAQRAAAAVDLFGKQGPKILKVAEELEKYKKLSESVGLGISERDLVALDEASDSVDQLRILWDAGVKKAVAEVAPYIVALVNRIKEAIVEAGGFDGIWKAIKSTLHTVANVIAIMTAMIVGRMVAGAAAFAVQMIRAGKGARVVQLALMRTPIGLISAGLAFAADKLGVDLVGGADKFLDLNLDIKGAEDQINQALVQRNNNLNASVVVADEYNKEQLKILKAFDEQISKLNDQLKFEQDKVNLGEEQANINKMISEEQRKMAEVGLSITEDQKQRITNAYTELENQKNISKEIERQKATVKSLASAYKTELTKALEDSSDVIKRNADMENRIARGQSVSIQEYIDNIRAKAQSEYNLTSTVLALTDKGAAERYAIETKYDKQYNDLLSNRFLIEQNGVTLKNALVNQQMSKELELYNLKVKLANDEVALKANTMARIMSDTDMYYLKTIGGEKAIQEAAKARAEFEAKTIFEKTQIGIEQGAQLFSALGAQNKKAFEAAKALNIASAIMNTYASVTKALAAYPFPFSLIPAGAALAMGMAQVSQIRAQSYSGRALGGPVMGGNPYIVGESGPELFTPQGTGSITRNGDLGGGGPTNINFTILANDAQGFDDLLAQRKGMITQMVNDAMVEKGQRM